MSKTLQYTRPNRLDALQDQLWAAGIRPERVTGLGDSITIVVPDGADMATVQAVVGAHNVAALDAAEKVTAAQESTTRAGVQALTTAFLSGTDLTVPQLNTVIRWLVRQRLAQGG